MFVCHNAHVSSCFSPVRFEERSSCHQLSQNSSETLFPNHRKQEWAVVLKLFRRGKGIVKVIHCKWRFTQTRDQWFTSEMTQLWEPGLDSLRHKHFWPPVARTSKEVIVTSTLISVKKTAPASLFFQRVFWLLSVVSDECYFDGLYLPQFQVNWENSLWFIYSVLHKLSFCPLIACLA